jgi:hypothetical protein
MLNFVLNLAGQTLSSPRAAAKTVFDFDIDRRSLVQILLLVSVVSVLFTEFTMLFVPAEMLAAEGPLPDSALLLAVVIASLLAISSLMTHFVGRTFGGKGELDDSLKAVIWMQIVMLVLQVVQIVLFLISPIVALLFGWGGALYMFGVFMVFVQVLHGFKSLGGVVAGTLISVIGLMIGIALVIAMIAGIFGVELAADV